MVECVTNAVYRLNVVLGFGLNFASQIHDVIVHRAFETFGVLTE